MIPTQVAVICTIRIEPSYRFLCDERKDAERMIALGYLKLRKRTEAEERRDYKDQTEIYTNNYSIRQSAGIRCSITKKGLKEYLNNA